MLAEGAKYYPSFCARWPVVCRELPLARFPATAGLVFSILNRRGSRELPPGLKSGRSEFAAGSELAWMSRPPALPIPRC